jgi:H+/Cl- antiporter ClcA
MSLRLLLRLVQHVAYYYSLHTLVGGESFLQGVTAASPLRRFLVLCVCGAVAGIGWWALFRLGKPLVSISQAVRETGPRMPFLSTVIHVLLQIVTVALGSPLGREVAPRELGALFATQLSERAHLSPQYRRIMIACGAGAGLADDSRQGVVHARPSTFSDKPVGDESNSMGVGLTARGAAPG